mgnify:CR=1 FL=1
MEVSLLQHSSLNVALLAIRTCYNSEELSDTAAGSTTLGPKDKDLLKRIIDSKHHSTIEHVHYTFLIRGISRACLQELARHRIASLSVKSTRYTLGKLRKVEHPFTSHEGRGLVSDYLVLTGNSYVDYNSTVQLEEVRQGAWDNIPNDDLKMMLPESFKTTLVLTINARSLRNLLDLRLSHRAHWEIRKLAQRLLELVPDEHQILFEDIAALHTKPEEAQK